MIHMIALTAWYINNPMVIEFLTEITMTIAIFLLFMIMDNL